jgi:CDP-glycerol glycerophosphotransferase
VTMRAPQPSEHEPQVSIVVIVFNDESRIKIAIQSALAQSLRDIEVVVVDHGSTDDTVAVVQRWAATDSRLRILELGDNEGEPGRPLNAGIDAARGRFVTLMGSDDEIDLDACRAMVAAAEVHDADVVMGRTDRIFLDEGSRVGSWFHRIYRQGRQVHENIHERPGLMWDTISAAKLYRRSFLNEHGLRLPEDLIYEDQLFTAEVYLRARRIVVLPQTVYRWTVLGKSQTHRPSLTNTRDSVKNLHDRVTVNRRIDELYIAEGATDLLLAKQRKFFSHDLYLYFRDLGERDDAYRATFLKMVGEYVRATGLDQLIELEQPLRALAFALRSDDLEAARQAFEMHRNNGRLVPLLERRGERVFLAPHLLDCDPQAADFLDVTSLWDGGPSWRNLHVVASVHGRIDRRELELEGELHDPLGMLGPSAPPLKLEFRRRQTPRVACEVACEVERQGPVLRWRAVISSHSFPSVLSVHQIWDASILVDQGSDKPIRVRIFTEARELEAAQLKTTFPVSALIGRRLACYSTTKGNLSLRLEQQSAVTPIVRRLRPMVSHAKSLSRWLRQQPSALDRRLAPVAYWVARRLPVRRDLVVFESFEGRSYAGDPRRISEALAESHPDLKQVWLCASRAVSHTLPTHTTAAGRGSIRASYLLGRAAYWVDNFGLPAWYGKPERTCYLQTWHGTPVKLMMLDALSVATAGPERQRQLQELASRWDILLSTGTYFNDTFVRSCNTSARILTVGAPRTDWLVTNVDTPASMFRSELGLSPDDRVVLYAPTYRPGPGWVLPAIDWDLLVEGLDASILLLVRNHYFRKSIKPPARVQDRFVDVTKIPDVNRLLLASDVLVTDFSSLMFDFSLLERPIVVFAPDLDRYEQAVGTYLDLRRSGPGPLAESTEELVTHIGAAIATPAPFVERSAAFRKIYSDAEQGTATRAVVDEIWGQPHPGTALAETPSRRR